MSSIIRKCLKKSKCLDFIEICIPVTWHVVLLPSWIWFHEIFILVTEMGKFVINQALIFLGRSLETSVRSPMEGNTNYIEHVALKIKR